MIHCFSRLRKIKKGLIIQVNIREVEIDLRIGNLFPCFNLRYPVVVLKRKAGIKVMLNPSFSIFLLYFICKWASIYFYVAHDSILGSNATLRCRNDG